VRGAALAAAALALAASAGDGEARELWRRGELSLELSGSIRELALFGHETDTDRFMDAIVEDLESTPPTDPFLPTCLRAETFADCPAFDEVGEREVWQSLTRVRTRLDLLAPAGLSAVLVYDHELAAGTLDTLESELARGLAGDTFLGAEDGVLDREHIRWRHLLYRAYLQLETERVELALGRQRIAWGVGRLWNPIDRFNAISPLAIEGDQSPGVDAVLARWAFDGFNFLEAVYAPGTSRDEARAALRFHGVLRDTDVSLMGGLFEKAPTAGLDLERNLGDAAVHLEAVYTDPEQEVWPIGAPGPREPGDFWQVVLSFDTNLDLGSGLTLLVEHLYNGNALGFGEGKAGRMLAFFEATDELPPELAAVLSKFDPDDFPFPIAPEDLIPPPPYVSAGSTAIFGSSRVASGARHQTGVSLGYDLTPELRGDLLAVFDWNGESAALLPSLRYSPTGSLELTAGVQLFVGPERSEYGSLRDRFYLLAELFF
jgi:hypothetical protein